MSKVRINDLARELEVKSKAILDALPLVGVTEKKTHSSSIEDHEAEKVRAHIRGSAEAQSSSARSARPLRGEEEIKTKIDLSHISRPGDVLKAITQKKEAAAAPPPARPAAPPVAAKPAVAPLCPGSEAGCTRSSCCSNASTCVAPAPAARVVVPTPVEQTCSYCAGASGCCAASGNATAATRGRSCAARSSCSHRRLRLRLLRRQRRVRLHLRLPALNSRQHRE